MFLDTSRFLFLFFRPVHCSLIQFIQAKSGTSATFFFWKVSSTAFPGDTSGLDRSNFLLIPFASTVSLMSESSPTMRNDIMNCSMQVRTSCSSWEKKGDSHCRTVPDFLQLQKSGTKIKEKKKHTKRHQNKMQFLFLTNERYLCIFPREKRIKTRMGEVELTLHFLCRTWPLYDHGRQ